ncbi:phage tail sheath C-terminal domain-containing protein [Bradyrhizobium sp. S3.7.6]
MFTASQGGSNAGNAAPDVPVPVGSVVLAQQMFGRGSQIARMVEAFMNSNTTQQLWVAPVSEPSAGTAATGTISISSAATASGVLTFYIAGQKVQINVASTDTQSIIATNLAAAINAANDLPVTAVAATGDVNLTCKWKGDTGSDITLIPNYLGQYGGEAAPTGMAFRVTAARASTSATTTTASPSLTFTAVPGNVAAGMQAYDKTTSAIIGTVLSTTSTTVTLAANAASAVGSADVIEFRSTLGGSLAGGLGQPSFTAVISAIQTLEFDYCGLPFSDTASMSSWNNEYGFGATGRWNYVRQQYGVIFSARRDTYAALLTWGLSQNAPVISTMSIETDSPSPIWEWTASYCALGSLGFSDDPARPLQTLEFFGILPARLQNRFTQSQNNSLVNSGLAVQATAPSGNPMILREQTQYQLNSYGQSDTAFALLSVLTNLQALLRAMKSAITSKYPRVKLVPDGTRIGPGQAAVTPTDIKAELIAEYGQAIYNGLAADMTNFKANLIVEIDSTDANRVNVLWPPRLAGQLRQFDALAQFRLQYQPQNIG